MFNCSMCGECCRHLDQSQLYKELDRGDGVCKYLDENICSIYDERPMLCRIDESYYKYFKNSYTIDEYYEMNYIACEMFKEIMRGKEE